jgi:hypothetical protein
MQNRKVLAGCLLVLIGLNGLVALFRLETWAPRVEDTLKDTVSTCQLTHLPQVLGTESRNGWFSADAWAELHRPLEPWRRGVTAGLFLAILLLLIWMIARWRARILEVLLAVVLITVLVWWVTYSPQVSIVLLSTHGLGADLEEVASQEDIKLSPERCLPEAVWRAIVSDCDGPPPLTREGFLETLRLEWRPDANEVQRQQLGRVVCTYTGDEEYVPAFLSCVDRFVAPDRAAAQARVDFLQHATRYVLWYRLAVLLRASFDLEEEPDQDRFAACWQSLLANPDLPDALRPVVTELGPAPPR